MKVGGHFGLVVFVSVLFVSSFSHNAHAQRQYKPKKPDAVSPIQSGRDPLIDSSWHLDRIRAHEAWKITEGAPSTKIAIIDSGIDYNHPEVAANIYRKKSEASMDGKDTDGNGYVDDVMGYNFNDEQPLPWDDNGHGTYVAAVAAGLKNNSVGSAGVCPKCSIIPIRFMDKDGFGDDEDAIRSIWYAVKSGAKVINLSFGGEGYDKDLHAALQAAHSMDIVVVVAAGNDGANNDREPIYPPNTNLPNIITVAGVRKENKLWVDSNWGLKKVHVAAPGTTIWGPWTDGKWYQCDGTSFAAPQVSGLAGLIRTVNPELSAEQVVKIIMATVDQQETLATKIKSGGVIDARAAVECAINKKLICLGNVKEDQQK